MDDQELKRSVEALIAHRPWENPSRLTALARVVEGRLAEPITDDEKRPYLILKAQLEAAGRRPEEHPGSSATSL